MAGVIVGTRQQANSLRRRRRRRHLSSTRGAVPYASIFRFDALAELAGIEGEFINDFREDMLDQCIRLLEEVR